MLRLDFSRQARKFLRRLPPKQSGQIAGKIAELRLEPRPSDSQPMRGSRRPYRRADIGEYRIIYLVQESTLQVRVIGKRNDGQVYRIFRRQI